MNIPNEQIGISTNIFDNPLDMAGLLEKLAKSGFKLVEVEFDNAAREILTLKKEDLNNVLTSIKQVKDCYGMQLTVHAPYIGTATDLAATDEPQRAEAVALMLKTMEVMSVIGAKNMTFHPGYLDRKTDTTILYKNLCQSLSLMSKKAAELNIDLCLENTGSHRPNYIVLTDEQQHAIFKQYGVYLTLDIIHFASFTPLDEQFYCKLENLLPSVKHAHFADMKIPKHAHLPLGRGDLPYKEILDFMYSHGYKGCAIIEECAHGYSQDDYLQQALQFKKSLQSV